jgi:hypothetical protein
LIGHFSAEVLANYRTGAMSESRAARISSHLSGCARCAKVDNDLTGVSQLLASIPAPAMPDYLTERLRSALAAEAAQRGFGTTSTRAAGDAAAAPDGLAAVGGPVAVGSPAPVQTPGWPDLSGRAPRRVRWPRMPDLSAPLLLRGLAATTVLMLLVGGGVLLANAGGGRSASTSGASSAPEARPQMQPGYASSVARIRLQYQHNGQYIYTNAVATGASYTKADLAAGVRKQVASSPLVSGGAVPRPTVYRNGHSTGQHLGEFNIGRLESCVSAVAAGRLVLLTEVARYLGVPAAIIVLQPVDGAFGVIVVGTACGASGQDVIARLTVPRG